MRILIAEDNAFYRRMLQATLIEWGYEVTAVADGAAAWDVLRAPDAPKLAVLDWEMPEMDGPEVCSRVRRIHNPEPTYLIILTVKDGKENIVTALERGADDYLSKPFNREELRARLRVGLRIVGLQTSQSVVYAFAQAVEAKSPYTRGHTDRVTQHALALADTFGVTGADREALRQGGLLHDIGKISVPDAILNKATSLDPGEWEIIKQHPANGVHLIDSLQSLRHTIPLIRWHHERLDGRGYPDGLAGDEVPFLVRILSVADVYDALANDRPYRVALPLEESLCILRDDAKGGGLAPDIVERFCAMMTDSGGGLAAAPPRNFEVETPTGPARPAPVEEPESPTGPIFGRRTDSPIGIRRGDRRLQATGESPASACSG